MPSRAEQIPLTPAPCWWEEEDEDVRTQQVWALAHSMEDEQERRRAVNNLLRSLYRMPGSRVNIWGDRQTIALSWAASQDALTYNLIRSAVDTLGAMVASTKPKAAFTTSGGDWKQRRRAMKLDRFVYGTFLGSNLYREGRQVFRDAAVCDLGAVRGYVKGGRVVLERVDPDELKVDSVDALYGKPRTLMHTRLLSRHEVWRMWRDFHPRASATEKEDARFKVATAQTALRTELTMRRNVALGDVVEIHEIWRLPSEEGADDGRHGIYCSNLCVLDEPWTLERFPFSFMRIFDPDQGFYGQGIAELLTSQQRTLNWMLRRLTRALLKMAVSRYFLPTGAKLNVDHLDTEVGVILRGTVKPELMGNENILPPDWFQIIPMTIRQGLEQVGINEAQVAASKSPGLNSGVAQRERADIESRRFGLVHQAWEDFYLDSARLVVDLARQATAEGEELRATSPGKRGGMETVDWEAAALDEGQYTLQIHSTSSLPATPTARRQFVAELRADGLLEDDEYRRLLQMPDLDTSEDLNRARRDAIDAIIERLMDGDEDEGAEDDYTPPDPLMDLAYGLQHALAVYNQAVVDRAPEARLTLLRLWITDAQDMMRQAQAAAAAAQQPPTPPAGATGPAAQAA